MRTYLISYDLGVPETSADYQNIIRYIKSLGSNIRPLQSQWFVVTSKSCAEIRDDLKSLTDLNDKILVIQTNNTSWAIARMANGVGDWIKSNI